MRIESININNFKVLDSVTLNPGMINIFVGRNNTGKSSLLQSIIVGLRIEELNEIFRRAPSAIINYSSQSGSIEITIVDKEENYSWVTQFRHGSRESVLNHLRTDAVSFFKFLKKAHDEPSSIRHNIEISQKTYESVSSFDDASIQEMIDEALFDLSELIESVIANSVEIEKDGDVAFYGGHPYNRISLELLSKVVEKITAKTTKDRRSIERDVARYFTITRRLMDYAHQDTQFGSTEEAIIANRKIPVTYVKDPHEFLKNLRYGDEANLKLALEIETIIKDERIVPNLLRFTFEGLVLEVEGEKKEVPMDSMGDGFKTLISILASLKSSPKNSILILEEPEVHLHPGYIRELVRYLVSLSSELNIQLFISTHSSDMIEHFLSMEGLSQEAKKYVESELRVIRMSRKEDTVITEEFGKEEARESYENLLMDLRGI